jgi:hypothetical protein
MKIGNTMAYSGPASAYGIIGKTIAANFDKINAEGVSMVARQLHSPILIPTTLQRLSNGPDTLLKTTRVC